MLIAQAFYLFANSLLFGTQNRLCHKAHHDWNLLIWNIALLTWFSCKRSKHQKTFEGRKRRGNKESVVLICSHSGCLSSVQIIAVSNKASANVCAQYYTQNFMLLRAFFSLIFVDFFPLCCNVYAGGARIHTHTHTQSHIVIHQCQKIETLIFEWNLFRTMICVNSILFEKQQKSEIWFLSIFSLFLSIYFIQCISLWSTFHHHNEMQSLKVFGFIRCLSFKLSNGKELRIFVNLCE